jgi:hypothetical protein
MTSHPSPSNAGLPVRANVGGLDCRLPDAPVNGIRLYYEEHGEGALIA